VRSTNNFSGRLRPVVLTLAIALFAGLAAPIHAAQVGEILACYACSSTGNAAVDAALANNPDVASDAILFAFVNTSGSPITGGVFSEAGLPADSFVVPTIGAGSTFILIPGVTSDGGSHPSGGLFSLSGVMDTSDGAGGLNDDTEFTFTGVNNGLTVSSLTAGTFTPDVGSFTPGDTGLIKPFVGNPTAGMTSFIGMGPNGDGPCTNCYFGEVATLDTPNPMTGVPEPATMGLLGIGACVLAYRYRRLVRTR